MCNKAAVEPETSRFHHKDPFIHILTDPEQQTRDGFPLVELKFVWIGAAAAAVLKE